MTDRIIAQLSTAFKEPETTDAGYRFTYVNSIGGKVRFFRDRIEYETAGAVEAIPLEDIISVSVEPAVKGKKEDRVVSIKTSDALRKILVDTGSERSLDIFVIYRLLSRLAVSNRKPTSA